MKRSTTRRPILLVASATGAMIGLLGLAGVFASVTSTARAEDNRYASGEFIEQPEVDLTIAPATLGPDANDDFFPDDYTCGEYSQTTSALWDYTEPAYDEYVGGGPNEDYVSTRALCVRNEGKFGGQMTISVQDLMDFEVDCTGSEAEVDDTCGEGPGELSGNLVVVMTDCLALSPYYGDSRLDEMAVTPHDPELTLEPGEERCMEITVNHLNVSEDQRRMAQSDEVEWTFQFDLSYAT